MRGLWILIPLFVVSCRPSTPDLAAPKYGLQVSNGLQFVGAVAVDSQEVITDVALVPEGVRAATVRDAHKKQYGAVVLRRNNDIGYALLFTEDHTVPFPKMSECTGDLQPGSPVAVQAFEEDGTNRTLLGTFVDFRFGESRVWLETDIETPEEYRGSGFFGPDGTLIGVQAFKLAPKLTYLMPIEYIANGRDALTTEVVGYREDCVSFAAKRKEAENHPDPMPTPIKFSDLISEQMFSKTALVGYVSLLDKKDDPAVRKPVKWQLEAVDAERKARVIGAGTIEKKNSRWDNAGRKAYRDELAAAFGEGWVGKNFDPYDWGEYRYRIPFATFCKEVTDQEVHNLTIMFADGRSTAQMGFSDMVNICAGEEPGQGTDLEIAWGLAPKEAAPAAPEPAKTGKKKRKKKKKKRR